MKSVSINEASRTEAVLTLLISNLYYCKLKKLVASGSVSSSNGRGPLTAATGSDKAWRSLKLFSVVKKMHLWDEHQLIPSNAGTLASITQKRPDGCFVLKLTLLCVVSQCFGSFLLGFRSPYDRQPLPLPSPLRRDAAAVVLVPTVSGGNTNPHISQKASPQLPWTVFKMLKRRKFINKNSQC